MLHCQQHWPCIECSPSFLRRSVQVHVTTDGLLNLLYHLTGQYCQRCVPEDLYRAKRQDCRHLSMIALCSECFHAQRFYAENLQVPCISVGKHMKEAELEVGAGMPVRVEWCPWPYHINFMALFSVITLLIVRKTFTFGNNATMWAKALPYQQVQEHPPNVINIQLGLPSPLHN